MQTDRCVRGRPGLVSGPSGPLLGWLEGLLREALQRGTGPSRHRVGAEEESRTCEIWAPWLEGNFNLGLAGCSHSPESEGLSWSTRPK